MARYRKIDPRIWGDERFYSFSITQKLAWIALLTHPSMTPIGAGIFTSYMLDDILGIGGSGIPVCPICFNQSDEVYSSEPILEGFKEASLILRDNGLVIVKNFLIYNRPDNSNQLSGWIEWCEELPRSSIFSDLRDYLHDEMDGQPEWLFDGLLNPLAEQKNKNLKALFWDRVSEYVDKPSGRIKKGSKDGIKKASKMVPRTQEQEQEQDKEQDTSKNNISSEDFDKFWQHFKSMNRHIEKVKTEKAWATTLKGRPGEKGHPPVEPSTLIEAANHYRMKCEMDATEPKFIKHPATFLGPDRHWEDYKDVPKPSGNGNGRRVVTRPGEYDDVFEEA